MGRPLRAAAGGFIYHTMNRANGRLRIFYKNDDYQAFEHTLAEALERSDPEKDPDTFFRSSQIPGGSSPSYLMS